MVVVARKGPAGSVGEDLGGAEDSRKRSWRDARIQMAPALGGIPEKLQAIDRLDSTWARPSGVPYENNTSASKR